MEARARVNRWEKGDRDVPHQHEAEAVERAFRLAGLCRKSFRRVARRLANTRRVR